MKIESVNDNLYISSLVESMVDQVSKVEEKTNISLSILEESNKKKTRTQLKRNVKREKEKKGKENTNIE